MTTRVPLFASVPYSSLPIPDTPTQQEESPCNVDILFDELDSASDSGYDDIDKEQQQRPSSVRDQDDDTTDQDSSKQPNDATEFAKENAGVLVDGPPLFPGLGATGISDGPAWTHWTSSSVTSLDTAYGSTEEKLDCVWLVAGCRDGSLWLFCSILAIRQESHHDSEHNFSRKQRVSSVPNLLATVAGSRERPALPRKSSDFLARRISDAIPHARTSGGSSPPFSVHMSHRSPSKEASVISTRSGYRKHRSSHSNSISLARSGAATPSSHSHGRKASATVSVIDMEALGGLGTSSTASAAAAVASVASSSSPLSERRASKDISGNLSSVPAVNLHRSTPSPHLYENDRPSFSFEELQEPPPFDYHNLSFKLICQVKFSDTCHSPITSVCILPQQGAVTPCVCMTENGKAFKVSCQDGTLLGSLDLARAAYPRSSKASFSKVIMATDQKKPWVLAIAEDAGIAVVFDTEKMSVLEQPRFQPGSLLSAIQSGGETYLLQAAQDKSISTSQLFSQNTSQERERHAAGSIDSEMDNVKGLKVSGEDIIVWSDMKAVVLQMENQKVVTRHVIESTAEIKDMLCVSAHRLAIITQNLVRFEATTPQHEGHEGSLLLDFSLDETIESASLLAPPTSTNDALVLVTRDKDGLRSVGVAPVETSQPSEEVAMHIAFEASRSKAADAGAITATAALKLDGDTLAVGYSDGRVCTSKITAGKDSKALVFGQLAGQITLLTTIATESNSEDFLVAGSAEGSLGIWHRSTRTLIAQFDPFECPIVQYASTPTGLVIIAASGACAVLNIDNLTSSPLTLPAARASLERICFRPQQLLLAYAHGQARLWDLESHKLQKTMSQQEALSLVSHIEGWEELPIQSNPDAALSIDIRKILDRPLPDSQSTAITNVGADVRWLLSRYLLSAEEDYVRAAMESHLGVSPLSSSAITTSSHSSSTSYWIGNATDALQISQRVTAQHIVLATALCRVFLNYAETERYANEVIAYCATLGESVGSGYKDLSLDYLADFWPDESSDIKQAARLLFGARVARLSEDEVFQNVQERQARLLQTTSLGEPKELLCLGQIAIAKQDMLSTGILRDIADQVSRSLETTSNAPHQTVSLELLIQGFSVFQTYFDAVRVLRSIFRLATTTAVPVSIAIRNLARQAILTIASLDAPLFMTVLSFDAMQADADPEERAATMKLIAFMVRKKPVVLFASLPRLAEAVVRSLDPRTGLRGALQQTATVILSELVNTYPSIAFHGKTQRLAVGTHEGACIVYDLKTATRLYVLESHTKRASAVSYSPDGRRLVTVSLEDSNVKVWKVGVSLLGLLTPAGPPPQRHGSQAHEAYKTIDFALTSPEEAMMTAAAQLEWLTVEWPDEKRVKITIRQTALTFSVV